MRTKEWLVAYRNKNNLSREELATKIGISLAKIEEIEEGKSLGSVSTWKKITDFFQNPGIKVSYESGDLIEELEEDILEFGKDHECYLFYRILDGEYIVFTNYDYIVDEKPLKDKEIRKDEIVIKSTLGYALEVFEEQDKIL